jgi:hypothetical protein
MMKAGEVQARANRMPQAKRAALAKVAEDAGPDVLPLRDEFAGMAGAEAGEGCGYVVAGEEEDVSGQVERRVEEGVETEEATKADEEGDAGRETTHRGDGEGGQEDVNGPVAGEVGNVVDGVGVEREGA